MQTQPAVKPARPKCSRCGRAGGSPKPGSYAGRHTSEPAGGVTSLTDESLYDGTRAQKIERLPNAPEPEPAA